MNNKYINEKLETLDSDELFGLNFKKSYIDDERYDMFERSLKFLFKELYDGGYLNTVPKAIIAGLYKVNDITGDNFSINIVFNKKEE